MPHTNISVLVKIFILVFFFVLVLLYGFYPQQDNTIIVLSAQTHQHAPKQARQHAIIIPYRGREVHIDRFKTYMKTYLKRFLPDEFSIWIIEQGDSMMFNRAWLLNVGLSVIFKAIPDVQCVIFHDVDRYPKEGVNYTDCHRPTQLSSENDQWNGGILYGKYSGGVVSLSKKHWTTINGMSNEFVGWGGEDDEFYDRLLLNKLLGPNKQMFKPPKGHGRFGEWHDTFHTKRVKGTYNKSLTILGEVRKGHDRWKRDGLNSVKYSVDSVHYHHGPGVMHLNVLQLTGPSVEIVLPGPINGLKGVREMMHLKVQQLAGPNTEIVLPKPIPEHFGTNVVV